MNHIVLRELARSRRGKAEAPARGVGSKIKLRRLAFGGDEVRPVQEMGHLLPLLIPFADRLPVPRLKSGKYLKVTTPRNAQRMRPSNATKSTAVAAAQARNKTGRDR